MAARCLEISCLASELRQRLYRRRPVESASLQVVAAPLITMNCVAPGIAVIAARNPSMLPEWVRRAVDEHRLLPKPRELFGARLRRLAGLVQRIGEEAADP